MTVADFTDEFFKEYPRVTLVFNNTSVYFWNEEELYEFKDEFVEESYTNSMGLHLVIDREVQKYEIA